MRIFNILTRKIQYPLINNRSVSGAFFQLFLPWPITPECNTGRLSGDYGTFEIFADDLWQQLIPEKQEFDILLIPADTIIINLKPNYTVLSGKND